VGGKALATSLIAAVAIAAAAWAKPGLSRAEPPFTPIAPVVARSSGDVVPRTARVLEISWIGTNRHPILVTNRTAVSRVAQLVNELPQEGQGACSEGFAEGPPTIRFSFRRTTWARALATATLAALQGYEVAWCIPSVFSARGHRPIRLEGGGYLLKRAGKILRRNLGH
jgi:hypothetical protein